MTAAGPDTLHVSPAQADDGLAQALQASKEEADMAAAMESTGFAAPAPAAGATAAPAPTLSDVRAR